MKSAKNIRGLLLYQEMVLSMRTKSIEIMEDRLSIPHNIDYLFLEELVRLKKYNRQVEDKIELLNQILND